MSPRVRSESTFDRELAAAARSIAVEPLPREVLDIPAAGVEARTGLAVARGLLAAAAVVVVAVWLGARLLAPPIGAPTDPFRPAREVSLELQGAGYACTQLLPSQAPVASPTPDAAGSPPPIAPDIVCSAPGNLHPVTGALVLEQDDDGAIDVAHVKAGILGATTGVGEASRGLLLERLTGIAFADADDAAAASAWVRSSLPLAIGERVETSISGIAIAMIHDDLGGYQVELTPIE